MMRVVMMTKMAWQVNEEVNRDMTGGADENNLEVEERDVDTGSVSVCS